jgi:hypothetical protein
MLPQQFNNFIPKEKKYAVVLVRKRTIPTKRPPLVSEVTAEFSG